MISKIIHIAKFSKEMRFRWGIFLFGLLYSCFWSFKSIFFYIIKKQISDSISFLRIPPSDPSTLFINLKYNILQLATPLDICFVNFWTVKITFSCNEVVSHFQTYWRNSCFMKAVFWPKILTFWNKINSQTNTQNFNRRFI